MKVEIITSSPCTACDGSGLVLNPRGGKLDCPNRCKRGVIVRKTTFADAAALRDAINAAINRDLGLDSCEDDEWNNTSAEVLAALGVNDDQSE